MTYTPPSKQTLQKSTKDLLQTFNGFAKLYFPPDYKTLRVLIDKLEEDYKVEVMKKASNSWRLTTPTPDQTRLDQIACITALSLHLPDPLENIEKLTDEQEAKFNQAHMILLGALLYRYLRIESSYTGGITGGLGVFGSADNSALKVVLAKLLNVTNVNVLDPQTIASCCTEYRNYLKQSGNSDRYSYIKKDAYFFANLDTLIQEAELDAKPVNEKIQHIIFVKSVPALLSKYETLFTEMFQQLRLAEKLKEKTPLDCSDVQSALKKLNLDSSVNDFFEHHFLTDDLAITAETLDEFKADITMKMQIMYQYALLGAYIMGIEKCKPSMSDETPSPLCKALQFSIGVKVDNPLDIKSKNLALSALQQFVKLSSAELPLNLDAWGGSGLFKAELLRQLEATQNKQEEPEKIVFSI